MTSEPSQDRGNPWRALAALRATSEEDRHIIELTRDDDLHIVNNLVAATRVSLLYAASGNGKTSLLQAGVVPYFEKQGYVVFTVRPRPPWSANDPIAAMRDCIKQQLGTAVGQAFDRRALDQLEKLAGEHNPELETLTRRLRTWVDALPNDERLGERLAAKLAGSESTSLHGFVSEIAGIIDRTRPILIILDQFEELFVHYANHPLLNTFARELGRIWADSSLNVRLLFSMREDWVGSMIVLRRDIPEIFRDTYRLMPLRHDAAIKVLTEPLPSRGFHWGEGVPERIANDLATLHENTDMRQAGRIALDDGREKFVDASSLQLVASHLWETRLAEYTPFSNVHYETLARPDQAGNPAEQYVERYLSELLGEDITMRRLQIDALYQLTDGVRHRRASTAATIKLALGVQKRDEGTAPNAAAIHEALQPLVDARIVKESVTPDGVEYELGHDYVVRGVVKLWTELDRLRANEAGRRAKERERTAERLGTLEKRDETMTTILQVAPAVGIIGLIWSALALYFGNYNVVRFSVSEPSPGILIYAAFIVLGVLALLAKHRLSIIMTVIALVTVLIVAIGITNEQRIVKTIQNNSLIAAKSWLDDVNATKLQDEPTFLLHQKVASELQLFSRKLADPLGSAQLLYAIVDHQDGLSRIYDRSIHTVDDPEVSRYAESLSNSIATLRTQRSSLISGRWIGVIILSAATIAILLIYLRSAASLQSSDRWALVFDLMWIDLVDLLTFAVPLAVSALGSVVMISVDWQSLALSTLSVVVLARLVIAARFKATLGMLLMHKRLIPIRPRGARFASIQRELVFTFWAALNIVTVGLLWLTVLPAYVAYRGRMIVDLLAGTRLEESSAQPATGTPSTAQQAAASA